MKGPDPRLLPTLLAVLRHGSITAAAAALGYVPSAVSQQMTRLERQMGVELLSRRSGGAVTPTAAGRAIADAAVVLLAATADFQARVGEVAGAGAPELRVGMFPTAASEMLPSALANLRAKHPDFVLTLLATEPVEGLRLLRAAEIDLLLAYRYLPEDPPAAGDLQVLRLGREPLLLMASAEIPALTDRDSLLSFDWVAGPPGTPDRRLFQRWAHKVGLAPTVRFETDDYHITLSLIAYGLGIGLVPLSAVCGWRDPSHPVVRVHAMPAKSLPTRDVLAVTRPRYRHPAARVLLAHLRSTLAAQLTRVRDTAADMGGWSGER